MANMVYYNIKSCPLCGGKGKLETVGDNKSLYIIRCQNCQQTVAKNSEARSTILGAIAVWNGNSKGEIN